MSTLQINPISVDRVIERLAGRMAKRASSSDRNGTFVFENYEDFKEHQLFSAMIPEELGGGGVSYSEMCDLIRKIAHHCGSTALAFSMHQHLVAASVWKYIHKGVGRELLERVVNEQLVLISTGARDWLASNGTMDKVKGGYLFTGIKRFASQSIAGDIAITSAPYKNPEEGDQVLHFGVPMDAEGVSVLQDWQVLGMRATGSHSIAFDKVFIPEAKIALARPQGGFHMVWNIVLTVAMPLIMSAYVGIAERAQEIAIEKGKAYYRNQDHISYLIGKLNNSLLSAQAQLKTMILLADDLQFQPSEKISMQIISYKTNIADAAIQTVSEAMEAIGGQSFYEKNTLERLFRDVQAAQFHPMPKWNQYAFTGKRLLGVD